MMTRSLFFFGARLLLVAVEQEDRSGIVQERDARASLPGLLDEQKEPQAFVGHDEQPPRQMPQKPDTKYSCPTNE
jgi:hypothetical protein